MGTSAQAYSLIRSSMATGTFPTLAATTTKPSGTGVMEYGNGPLPSVPHWASVVFFGTGSDNQTAKARLTGWRLVGDVWVPVTLGQWDLTLSTSVGVAGATILDTHRLVDTIAVDAAYSDLAGVAFRLASPANNTPAHLLVDLGGFPLRQWTFELGNASGINGMEAPVNW